MSSDFHKAYHIVDRNHANNLQSIPFCISILYIKFYLYVLITRPMGLVQIYWCKIDSSICTIMYCYGYHDVLRVWESVLHIREHKLFNIVYAKMLCYHLFYEPSFLFFILFSLMLGQPAVIMNVEISIQILSINQQLSIPDLNISQVLSNLLMMHHLWFK